MKKQADPSLRHKAFAVGQLVYLSTKNISFKGQATKKFSPKFIGPFQVLQTIGQVAYRLELPDSMARLHPVVHVSLLRE